MAVDLKTRSIERRMKSVLPSRLKSVVARLLTSRGMGRLVKALNPRGNLFGGVYDYSLVSDRDAAQIFFGVWESAEIRFSKRFADNPVVVELGSSVGVTLGVLAVHLPDARLLCVEANPDNFAILQKLRERLPRPERIELIHRAIAYAGGPVAFDVTSVTGSKLGGGSIAAGRRIEVDSTTLSALLASRGIDGPYTLITDIEGAEADVFFRDPDALAGCTKIVCELEDTAEHAIAGQIERLRAIGFEVHERYGNVFFLAKPAAESRRSR
ncbi:MAG: FkbM family methyltransferase [Myxococcales bacterium]|nr:FkbM family methyltransferase [Myxococcales bacterium]